MGEYYTGQFGSAEGKAAIRAHYLTGEQIHVQPWLFSDDKALLRSSRQNSLFKKMDGVWKIARTRTETCFFAPLPNNYAEAFPSESVLMRD